MALTAVSIWILLYRLASAFGSRPWMPVLPILVIAGCEALYGLALVLGPGRFPVAAGTFGNRNHFAGFLEMCIPFAFAWMTALLRSERVNAPRAVTCMALCGLMAACLAAVAFSGSRMGFFATGAGLTFAALMVMPKQHRNWLLLPVAAGVIAFLSLAPGMLIERFGSLDEGDASRTHMWRDAVEVIKAYPLTGVGYGAYMSAAGEFQSTAPMLNVDYAHNDYLQLTAELGIPAMLFLLTGAISAVTLTWHNARRAPTLDLRYRAIAALGAYLAIALHSFVDFNLYVPVNLLTIAWIAGIGTSDVSTAAPDPIPETA